MITDSGSNVYRNGSGVNGSSSNILENLYEFLKEAELQHYFEELNIKLKVRSTSQLKYVDETDLQSIGMTRPEMRRLKKYFAKEFPQTAMGKIKKRLTRTTSGRSTSVPRPEDLSNRMNSFTSRFNSNGQSISPMDSDELATIASVTNFSIASNGTNDSCDWKLLGSKYVISHNQLTLGPIIKHGDFGDIYKGSFRPTPLQIQVAVKVINRITLRNDVNDFVRELFTNCYLDHANIAKLYGVCIDDYSIKMVTELAPYGSLADCLMGSDSKIKYPITILHNFVVQISHGGYYLEEKRVVHGRLTIRNVLVFSDNKVKLTDAGLFRAQASLERSDTPDTNVWLAPEISKGYKESTLSDVWAFGVLLWEIFSYCQHSPLSLMDESMTSLMEMKLPYLPQPDLCPNMIFNLIKTCWNDSPKERPSFYQLSTELVRLEPEQVVAMVDGPDLIPPHRSEETNEPSDDSYSSLTEMQMLYYKADALIIVLDRSMLQYKELWRGCLLSGECGYFKWANMRAVGVTEVLQAPKIKGNLHSPATSNRSNGRNIGEALSKIHISRKEDKKKQGRLSVDMISGPQNDFRHVGHVGANGDVFGDVTSLYASPAQQKVRSGSVSISSKSEYSSSFSEASSIISSTTLNAQTGGDTPPYATIDHEPINPQPINSKEYSKKVVAVKDVKTLISAQPAPPLPPVRSHSEDDSNFNIYLDDLTIESNFPAASDGFSLFDELSKHWEMQSSKLESPTLDSIPDIVLPYESLFRKSSPPSSSSQLNEDYCEVYDDDSRRSNSSYVPPESVNDNVDPRPNKAQRSASVMITSSMVTSSTNPVTSTKSNIFQKFRSFAVNNKPTKASRDSADGRKSPVYAKVFKPSKSKKEKDCDQRKKNVISEPILISAPVLGGSEATDDNYLDCSSEVSSLQPSPRDSVLCLSNPGTEPSPRFLRQHSNITTSSRGRTSDSTITSVSPASSFASLTSTPANNVLQGGAALRALRKGDGVFRAASGANAFNRKRPSVGQIQFDQSNHNDATISRTRQPSLPLTSGTVKMSLSAIERHNSFFPNNDNYEQLDSSATTPIASELPDLPYIDLSFVRKLVPERMNQCCEEEDAYNSLHSGSLGSDSVIEPRVNSSHDQHSKLGGRDESRSTENNNRSKYCASVSVSSNNNQSSIFSMNGDHDDEVAL